MPTTKNFERRTPRATSVASSASGGNPIGGFVKNLFGGGGQQSNISNLLFGPQKNIFQQIAGVLPSAPQAPSGMGELATLGYMKGARQNKWVSGAKALLGGIGSGQQMVQERQQRQQASSMLEQAGMEVTGFKWDTKNQKMVPTFGSKAKGILEQKKYELDLRKQESKEQGELSKALVKEDEKSEKRKIEGEKRRIEARREKLKYMRDMPTGGRAVKGGYEEGTGVPGLKLSPKLAVKYGVEAATIDRAPIKFGKPEPFMPTKTEIQDDAYFLVKQIMEEEGKEPIGKDRFEFNKRKMIEAQKLEKEYRTGNILDDYTSKTDNELYGLAKSGNRKAYEELKTRRGI